MIDSVSQTAGSQADLKTRRMPAAAQADRLPPHSVDAEQGVLGCALLSPTESLAECVGRIESPQVFYDLRHQTIYRELVSMFEDRDAVDVITLQQRLKDKQLLEQVGGIAYLATLPDTVPSAANLSYYMDIVLEKHLLRKLLRTCTDVVGRVYEFEGKVDSLLDNVETEILHISGSRAKSRAASFKDAMTAATHTIEAYHAGSMDAGISTGLTDLDAMIGGLRAGELFILAGRPSTGKTSLAANIAEHVALALKVPVAFFSLEMTIESLALRMLCGRAEVNWSSVRRGYLTAADFSRLSLAYAALIKAPMFIDDSTDVTITRLRAKALRLQQLHGIKLIIVDYMGLVAGGRARYENRQVEVSDVSKGCKAMAKAMNVPVIVLSQLNREQARAERKPKLTDLRESGAIEADADIVGMLWTPDEKFPASVDLVIAKQRNGPTGDVYLHFNKSATRFHNAAATP